MGLSQAPGRVTGYAGAAICSRTDGSGPVAKTEYTTPAIAAPLESVSGEQITNAFISLTYLVVPVLFMGLHVFVAFLQAYVFSLLTMIYVSMATAHEH